MENQLTTASSAQLQSWLAHQQHISSGKSTELLSLRFSNNNVDIPLLKKAIRELIQRHESLRTCFNMKDEFLNMEVAEGNGTEFELEVHYIQENKDPHTTIENVVQEGNNALQNLMALPLLKTYLFIPDRHTFIFRLYIHPIIADIPSLSILKEELNKLYLNFIQGIETTIPPLRIQLKDYVRQENKNFSKRKEDLKSFWMNKTQNLPQYLDWNNAFSNYEQSTNKVLRRPMFRDRNSLITALDNGQTAAYGLKLDQIIYKDLENLSKSSNTGPSAALYTSLSILFYMINAQKQILLASPVSLRASSPTASQLIANFDAKMYLKWDILEEDSFSDILIRTYADFIRSHRKAITSHDSLGLDKQLMRANCSVYMNYQHQGITGKPNKVNFSEGHEQYGSTDYMLNYEVLQNEYTFECKWYYNTSLFTPEFIEWIALMHKEILCTALLNPNLTIGMLKEKFIPQQ